MVSKFNHRRYKYNTQMVIAIHNYYSGHYDQSIMTVKLNVHCSLLYLLRHRCEYTTGIIERGCGRETDKARLL